MDVSPSSGCRPPAKIAEEAARYEQAAQVRSWQGPRYRMTYRVLGEGPPLIWAPGIATTPCGHAMALNRLAERFQTIQYSYPGDEPGDGSKLARIGHDHLVDDLFGLIDHLGLERVFLVGASFGATVVIKALQREPQRFPRAVLQGAFAHRRFTVAERLALAIGRWIPGNLARLPLRQRILSYNCRADFPAVIEDRWGFHLEQNGLTPISALAHRTSLLTKLDLRPILSEIPSELLLIHGREDRTVPLSHLEVLKAALPRADVAIMPTVGHIPHLTHVESLTRLIGDWLLPCPPEGCSGGVCESRGGPGCSAREHAPSEASGALDAGPIDRATIQ